MSTSVIPFHGSYLMPSLDHATVGDAMHPGVLASDPEATLAEVARLMASRHVHCVAVLGLKRSDHGEALVWGTISDVDLIRAGLDSAGDDSAAAIAREPVIVVERTTPLREAAQAMLGRGVSHAVVVEPNTERPVGILSTLDIAGVLAWGEA